ncbi:glycerol-3-phosphate 1-O-acyltransferase PlsY [Candidatus Finniella inopinata]|uniref:Glycerol-3-phosphate acyltransferase n=1 Tax=Candidatus Finniella inopinata TaxID=1696036 RepID=A0A4Q7DHK5_9PROT|nr:glycerol-3-phosphate 1-O-acyltransferase PlsY [Candidatus Finniella inopinata]RZI46192.1 glycerol-3-phosphate 1-O-acyltransferase [Candidatus Finniella inopinata]
MGLQSALWVLAGYGAGSVPFGLIFSHLFSLGDIRSIGSGNIGATNVLRTGNKTAAILTLLTDALKGFLMVWISLKYTHSLFTSYGVGLAAIMGHIWPVWLGFRGGKGVATSLGVYLAWNPFLGIITLILWLGTTKIFRVSSLSALVAIGLSPLVAYGMWGMDFADVPLIVFTGLIAILNFYTHRDNLKRIIAGRESPIKL